MSNQNTSAELPLALIGQSPTMQSSTDDHNNPTESPSRGPIKKRDVSSSKRRFELSATVVAQAAPERTQQSQGDQPDQVGISADSPVRQPMVSAQAAEGRNVTGAREMGEGGDVKDRPVKYRNASEAASIIVKRNAALVLATLEINDEDDDEDEEDEEEENDKAEDNATDEQDTEKDENYFSQELTEHVTAPKQPSSPSIQCHRQNNMKDLSPQTLGTNAFLANVDLSDFHISHLNETPSYCEGPKNSKELCFSLNAPLEATEKSNQSTLQQQHKLESIPPMPDFSVASLAHAQPSAPASPSQSFSTPMGLFDRDFSLFGDLHSDRHANKQNNEPTESFEKNESLKMPCVADEIEKDDTKPKVRLIPKPIRLDDHEYEQMNSAVERNIRNGAATVAGRNNDHVGGPRGTEDKRENMESTLGPITEQKLVRNPKKNWTSTSGNPTSVAASVVSSKCNSEPGVVVEDGSISLDPVEKFKKAAQSTTSPLHKGSGSHMSNDYSEGRIVSTGGTHSGSEPSTPNRQCIEPAEETEKTKHHEPSSTLVAIGKDAAPLVNPLLDFVRGATSNDGPRKVSDALSNTELAYPKPDTFPLAFCARLLGFDVPLLECRPLDEDDQSGSAFIPDCSSLPLLKDDQIQSVPRKGTTFAMWSEQEKAANESSQSDNWGIEGSVDPFYVSLQQDGWNKDCLVPNLSANECFFESKPSDACVNEIIQQTYDCGLLRKGEWHFEFTEPVGDEEGDFWTVTAYKTSNPITGKCYCLEYCLRFYCDSGESILVVRDSPGHSITMDEDMMHSSVTLVLFVLAFEHGRESGAKYGLVEVPCSLVDMLQNCLRMVRVRNVDMARAQRAERVSPVCQMICDLNKCSAKYAIHSRKLFLKPQSLIKNSIQNERLLVSLQKVDEIGLVSSETRSRLSREKQKNKAFTGAIGETRDAFLGVRIKRNAESGLNFSLINNDGVETQSLMPSGDRPPHVDWKVLKSFSTVKLLEDGSQPNRERDEIVQELREKQAALGTMEGALEPKVRSLMENVVCERKDFELAADVRANKQSALQRYKNLPSRIRANLSYQQMQEDMEKYCDVCEEDTSPGNAIVVCDGCEVAVHQKCYGVDEVPHGHFFCHPCHKGVQDPICELCPIPTGAFLPCYPRESGNTADENKSSWVHALCARWKKHDISSGKVFAEDLFGSTESLGGDARKCCLCEGTRGAFIKCSAEDSMCSSYMHATCAKYSSVCDELLDDDVVEGMLCPNHSERPRKDLPRSSIPIGKLVEYAREYAKQYGNLPEQLHASIESEEIEPLRASNESGTTEALYASKESGEPKPLCASKESEEYRSLRAPKEPDELKKLDTSKESYEPKRLHASKESEERTSLHAPKETDERKPLDTSKESYELKRLHASKESEELELSTSSVLMDGVHEDLLVEKWERMPSRARRCDICDRDFGIYLRRCTSCKTSVCFYCVPPSEPNKNEGIPVACPKCNHLEAKLRQGFSSDVPSCSMCYYRHGWLLQANVARLKESRPHNQSFFTEELWCHAICARTNLDIIEQNTDKTEVDLSKVILVRGRKPCSLCGNKNGLKGKCVDLNCRCHFTRGPHHFHATCARQAGFTVMKDSEEADSMSLCCLTHSLTPNNLRAKLEDLLDWRAGFIRKKEFSTTWTDEEASIFFHASSEVVRILGWAWRWAEWWVESGFNWEPYEGDNYFTDKKGGSICSTKESRCNDARRCRLAAFGAALRNRSYDNAKGFDNESLERALKAVLETETLVGPLKEDEISFFVEWLARAYRSKSTLLGLGDDKIEVGCAMFCYHMADDSPKFELGARSLPGSKIASNGKDLRDVDDFLLPPRERFRHRDTREKKSTSGTPGHSTIETVSYDVPVEPPPKKGRGRPPKMSKQSGTVNRGPSRPRKIQASEGSNAKKVASRQSEPQGGTPQKTRLKAGKMKRGPGRPRKNLLPDCTTNGKALDVGTKRRMSAEFKELSKVASAPKRKPDKPRKETAERIVVKSKTLPTGAAAEESKDRDQTKKKQHKAMPSFAPSPKGQTFTNPLNRAKGARLLKGGCRRAPEAEEFANCQDADGTREKIVYLRDRRGGKGSNKTKFEDDEDLNSGVNSGKTCGLNRHGRVHVSQNDAGEIGSCLKTDGDRKNANDVACNTEPESEDERIKGEGYFADASEDKNGSDLDSESESDSSCKDLTWIKRGARNRLMGTEKDSLVRTGKRRWEEMVDQSHEEFSDSNVLDTKKKDVQRSYSHGHEASFPDKVSENASPTQRSHVLKGRKRKAHFGAADENELKHSCDDYIEDEQNEEVVFIHKGKQHDDYDDDDDNDDDDEHRDVSEEEEGHVTEKDVITESEVESDEEWSGQKERGKESEHPADRSVKTTGTRKRENHQEILSRKLSLNGASATNDAQRAMRSKIAVSKGLAPEVAPRELQSQVVVHPSVDAKTLKEAEHESKLGIKDKKLRTQDLKQNPANVDDCGTLAGRTLNVPHDDEVSILSAYTRHFGPGKDQENGNTKYDRQRLEQAIEEDKRYPVSTKITRENNAFFGRSKGACVSHSAILIANKNDGSVRQRCVVCCATCDKGLKRDDTEITEHNRNGWKSQFGCQDCYLAAFEAKYNVKIDRNDIPSYFSKKVVFLCIDTRRFADDGRAGSSAWKGSSCFDIWHSMKKLPDLYCRDVSNLKMNPPDRREENR